MGPARLAQPFRIHEQTLGRTEAVPDVQLGDLFARETLEIEDPRRRQLRAADIGARIGQRMDARGERGSTRNGIEQMPGVVVLRVQPSKHGAVRHILEPAVGILDDRAGDRVGDDADRSLRRTVCLRGCGNRKQCNETR